MGASGSNLQTAYSSGSNRNVTPGTTCGVASSIFTCLLTIRYYDGIRIIFHSGRPRSCGRCQQLRRTISHRPISGNVLGWTVSTISDFALLLSQAWNILLLQRRSGCARCAAQRHGGHKGRVYGNQVTSPDRRISLDSALSLLCTCHGDIQWSLGHWPHVHSYVRHCLHPCSLSGQTALRSRKSLMLRGF